MVMENAIREEPKSTNCPACGGRLQGRWCHACGQDTSIGPQALKEILREGVEEVFDVDSRMVRTLSSMVVQPSRLLIAYRDGASSLFVTPLKLFVVTTAFLLALLGLTDVVLYQFVWKVEDPAQAVTVTAISFADTSELANASSRDLWMQRRVDRPVDDEVYAALAVAAADESRSDSERRAAAYEIEFTADQVAISERLAAWLPNVVFLLAPLYALLLAPFFGRSRLFAEHLAFSFWAHAMGFILLMILAAANAFGAGLSALWLAAPYLIYLTVTARRYYAQSWMAAAFKSVTHSVIYLVLVLVPAAGIVAATVIDLNALWASV